MSQEMKAQVDDMKDFAQQAKLEMKIKSRGAKEAIIEGLGGEVSTSTKVADKLHNTADFGEQVKLELTKKTRDAKVDLDKTETKKSLDSAATSVRDTLVDAKNAVMEKLTPDQKVVEATSARGVDVSHIEGGKNAVIESQRSEAALREQRDADKLKEAKRQELVDSTKAKAADLKEKVAEKTEGVTAVLKNAVASAEVAIGNAALSLKDALDTRVEASQGQPEVLVDHKVSAKGIDISSAQNPRNEQLQATAEHKAALAAAAQPTLGDKIAHVAADIKASFVHATTTSPTPVAVAQTSATGIDISHAENPANAELQSAEAARLQREKAGALDRQKAVLSSELKDAKNDIKSDAKDAKNEIKAGAQDAKNAIKDGAQDAKASLKSDSHEVKRAIDQDDTLTSKLSALGESIQAAASVAGAKIAEKYHELTADAHAQGAAPSENSALGERIKAQKAEIAGEMGVAGSKMSGEAGVIKAEVKGDLAIAKAKLTGASELEVKKEEAKHIAAVKAAELKRDGGVAKAELSGAASEAKADANVKTAELSDKLTQAKNVVVEKAHELSAAIQGKTAELRGDANEQKRELKERLSDAADRQQPQESTSEKVIKKVLDAGVATKEAGHDAKVQAQVAASDAKIQAHVLQQRVSDAVKQE